MVLAGINLHNKTDVVVVLWRLNTARYIEEILANHVVSAAIYVGPRFLSQQGNTRPHAAILTRNFLQDLRIPVMHWPNLSLDLNPIEHFWYELDRVVRARFVALKTAKELTVVLLREWEDILPDDIRRLKYT